MAGLCYGMGAGQPLVPRKGCDPLASLLLSIPRLPREQQSHSGQSPQPTMAMASPTNEPTPALNFLRLAHYHQWEGSFLQAVP